MMLSRAALSRRAFAKTDIPAVQKRSFAQEGSTIKEVPQDQAKGSASAHQPEQHIKGNSQGQLTLVAFGTLCVGSVAWMVSGKQSSKEQRAAGDKSPDAPYPAASR